MPDIFDQIATDQGGDIFDQLEPAGDIFDEVATSAEALPVVETTPAAAEFPVPAVEDEVIAQLGPEVSTIGFGEKPEPGPGDLGLGPVKSVAKQILRFGPSLAKTANQAIGFAGGQVESTSKAIKEVSDNKFWQQAWAPYERAGAATKKFGLESAKDIQKNVLEGQPWLNLPDDLKGSLWENPSQVINPEWLTFNVGEAGTSMLPMIAATVAAGPAAGMAVGGGLEGFDLYGDLVDKGVDHDRAATASLSFGMVTAVLNKVGLDKIMKKIPVKGIANNLVTRLGAATTEATTEYMEEPFQAAFGAIAEGKSTDQVIDATLESLKNIDVIPGAFLLGGGAAGSVQSDLQSGDLKKVIAAVKKLDAAREESFGEFVKDLGPAGESMTEDQQREAFETKLQEGAAPDVFDEVQPDETMVDPTQAAVAPAPTAVVPAPTDVVPDVFDQVQPEVVVEPGVAEAPAAEQIVEETIADEVVTDEQLPDAAIAQMTPQEQLRHNAFTKPIDELTGEEARFALKYDQLTGIKSRRSFEELPDGNKFSSIDADGLKWVNDNISPDVGDAMLKLIGEAMHATELGNTAFHISGDEFYFTHPDAEVLDKANADMVQYLKGKPITAILRESGEEVTFTVGVSRGIAETKQEADARLKENKAERAALGRRSKSREDAPPSLSKTAGGRRGVSDRRGEARGEVIPEVAKVPAKKKAVKAAKPAPAEKKSAKPVVAKPVKATAPVASKPGKEFKGVIGDRVVKGPKPKAGTIKRREDILIPLLKALDQPVFQEAIKKGSTTLGDFLPEGHRIRTQSRSDLEVIAHEVAHLLDNTIYGGFKPGKNKRPWMRGNHSLYKTYRDELNGISYDKKMVAEGFAEFVRHWMTNTGTVDQATPEFNQYWEEFLASGMDGNPKIAKALIKARGEMSQWFAQELTTRMKSKIGEAFDPNVWTNTWAGTFRAATLDSMHGVLANELRLTGDRGPQAGGMFETMSLTRAAYSQADGSIRFGPIVKNKDGSFSYNTEIDSLHDVLKDVAGDLENFKLYAISRSANELKGQGRENRFTEGEIKAGQKLETPEFKKAFDKWLKFNNATLDFAQSMGLISAEQRKGWKRAQYLPFFSVSNKTQRGGSKRPGEATVTKMLTGSTRNLNDIVDNMVMSTSKLIVMSIKNQAMRNVVDTTIEAPGGAKWIRKVPKVSSRVKVMNEDVKSKILNAVPPGQRDMMESMLNDAEENLGDDFGQFFVHGQAPLGDNIIAVRRDGKLEYYQIVDDLLFRSFASMAAKEKGLVRQNLNTVRRLMQGTITTTLEFMGANLARDTLHGWVFTQNGFVPIVDSVRGMNSRILKDKDYQTWIANGGGMASYFIDEGALRKRMDKFLVKRGISPKSIIDTPRKFAWLIEAMGDATEASTRIGEFKKAVARGDNPRHAAYLSREISTDFAKRGDSEILGWMTDSIMFLNPAIQGLDRVYRGFTKDQNRGQIWAKSTMIATISVGLLLLNDDNDLYEGLDDFDKDGYWHFFIPVNDLMKRHLDPELVSTAKDGREYLHTRMPKLWEIGAMASIAERTTKHIMDTIKKENPDGGAFAETVRNIMIDQMKFDLVPAAINPLLEQAMNKNRFTQRKIVNTGLERNLPWAQYSPHTSEIPRRIGALTRNLPAKYQIAPARLQHLIQGYFNGWGYYGLFLTDNLLPGSRKASPRWDQFPVVKRFLEQHPRRTVFERDLFELLDESNKLEATFQKMQKNIILPTKSEFESRQRLLGPVLRETSQIIKELRDAVNLARLDPNVSRDDLRKLEDKVQGEVSKLAEQVVKPVKKELRKKDE